MGWPKSSFNSIDIEGDDEANPNLVTGGTLRKSPNNHRSRAYSLNRNSLSMVSKKGIESMIQTCKEKLNWAQRTGPEQHLATNAAFLSIWPLLWGQKKARSVCFLTLWETIYNLENKGVGMICLIAPCTLKRYGGTMKGQKHSNLLEEVLCPLADSFPNGKSTPSRITHDLMSVKFQKICSKSLVLSFLRGLQNPQTSVL